MGISHCLTLAQELCSLLGIVVIKGGQGCRVNVNDEAEYLRLANADVEECFVPHDAVLSCLAFELRFVAVQVKRYW